MRQFKKRYIWLTVFLLIFVGLSVRQYIILNKQRRNDTAEFINKQIILCGKSMEDASGSFEEYVKYEFANYEISDLLLPNPEQYNSIIRNTIGNDIKRIRRFYSQYQTLIKRITVENDSVLRSFERDVNNYFTVSDATGKVVKTSLKSVPVYILSDTSLQYIQPITNARGDLIANACFDLNVQNFMEYHFDKFYLGKNSWYWAINHHGGVIFVKYSETAQLSHFETDKLPLFQANLKENLTVSVQHVIHTPEEVNAYSVFYPISIFGTSYGILFSVNTDTLYEKQNQSNLAFFGYFLLLTTGIVILYSLIIKQMIQAQKKLQRSEELLRQANHASEILLTDPDFDRSLHAFLEISAKTLGYHRAFIIDLDKEGQIATLPLHFEWRDSAIRKPILDFLHQEDHEMLMQIYSSIVNNDHGTTILKITIDEFQEPLRSFMEDLQCKTIVNLPLYADESRYGILGYMDCISKRSDQEFESALLANFANAIGGALSIQLKNKELTNAKNEAVKANLAKSDFLSRISHELRTPLNSILGFTQLLTMSYLDDNQKKGVNYIHSSGKHLLNLINEVLDISRIESGQLSVNSESIEINQLLHEMVDVVSQFSASKNISMEFSPSNLRNLYVRADRQRLKQVLLNLMTNAVKYNHDGGLILYETEVFRNDTGDDFLKLSITDSGLGISRENLAIIFTPFERAGAEKTGIEGTGLGLAVVEKLMLAMGGKVGVNSSPGSGSTFWIELPMDHTAGASTVITDESISITEENSNWKGTVLYVEDNIPNIELVEQILENLRPGIQVITESLGKNAIELASDIQPDLILLDLNLPDIHGNEVMHALLNNPSTYKIPIVVVSADAIPHQITKLLDDGAKSYLTKPLDVIHFLKVIDSFTPGRFN